MGVASSHDQNAALFLLLAPFELLNFHKIRREIPLRAGVELLCVLNQDVKSRILREPSDKIWAFKASFRFFNLLERMSWFLLLPPFEHPNIFKFVVKSPILRSPVDFRT